MDDPDVLPRVFLAQDAITGIGTATSRIQIVNDNIREELPQPFCEAFLFGK
jgi:hypothetical protein